MSDASQREWRFYLGDMIDFTGKGVARTDGLDLAGFAASGRQHRSANGIGSMPCSVGLPASAQPGALPGYSQRTGRVRTMEIFHPCRLHHAMVGAPTAGQAT
ncbi:MAG TPA: hypothetical protein VFK46_01900 [Candidatus Macondimonas sp.]|nr:hypothetical protein [Candidatus Macondimonas sp.]